MVSMHRVLNTVPDCSAQPTLCRDVACSKSAFAPACSDFERTWPIVIVRWYSLTFFQMFSVASAILLLMTMDCQVCAEQQQQQEQQQRALLVCTMVAACGL